MTSKQSTFWESSQPYDWSCTKTCNGHTCFNCEWGHTNPCPRLYYSNSIFKMFYLKCETLSARGKKIAVWDRASKRCNRECASIYESQMCLALSVLFQTTKSQNMGHAQHVSFYLYLVIGLFKSLCVCVCFKCACVFLLFVQQPGMSVSLPLWLSLTLSPCLCALNKRYSSHHCYH